MDPLLVISPHLDDAVLSCGQFLSGWPGAIVITVCTAEPFEPVTTTFDANSGFASSHDAMLARRQEDATALGLLGARSLHLNMLDHQYRDEALDLGLLIEKLRALVERIRPVRMLAPLGIAHPDHKAVSRACRALVNDVPTVFYEEQPNRVLYPEETVDRGREIERLGWSQGFIGTGSIDLKAQAISAYRSQIWALDLHACLVPERYWVKP